MTVYRVLLPGEGWRYAAHLLRLSAEDRRARFMGALSDGAVVDYTRRIDWTRTVIIAAVERGEIRAAAELRREQLYGGGAELAVSVEADRQGQGLGKALVRRVVTAARNRGVKRLYMFCLADNRRMQRIAKSLLGTLEFDSGSVTSGIDLPPATPFTLAEEAIAKSALPLDIWAGQWEGGRAA